MIYTQIQFRQGSKSEWEEIDPILAIGEPAFETGSGKLKIGDGIKKYTQLPYYVNEENVSQTQHGSISDLIGLIITEGPRIDEYSEEYPESKYRIDTYAKQDNSEEIDRAYLYHREHIQFETPFEDLPTITFTKTYGCFNIVPSYSPYGEINIDNITTDGFDIISRNPNPVNINWIATA